METYKTQNDHIEIELAKKSLEQIKERIKELERHLREQRALARSFKNYIEKWSPRTNSEQASTT